MQNTEEEAEERPYPEDPLDWPEPRQIPDTFRKNMTETGPLKCPDGPYPRSEASYRRFFKSLLLLLFIKCGENWARLVCFIPKKKKILFSSPALSCSYTRSSLSSSSSWLGKYTIVLLLPILVNFQYETTCTFLHTMKELLKTEM